MTYDAIKCLVDDINADESIESVEYLTDGIHEDLPMNVKLLIDNANDLLIDPAGRLECVKRGVMISCGESDSYGWLTGVIHTMKGKVVFG